MVYPVVFAMVYERVFHTPGFVSVVARHVPPSRRRYEARNPTLSIRLAADEKEKLLKMRASTGKSLSSLLRQGLFLVETETEKARKQGYDEGYAAGFGKFEIPCTRCGKPVTMNSEKEKTRGILDEAFGKWGHSNCVRPG